MPPDHCARRARPIALVGLMGVGKTTVGRRLAKRLDLPFFDSDDEIEKASGRTVAGYFKDHGEEAFREGERRVIERLLDGSPLILATGGGAFIPEPTREILNAHAITIWLKGDFDMAVALNGGKPDPFTMYNRYWTKDGNLQHVANYIDDDLDRLMNEGREETDQTKRKVIFAEFEKHLAEMSPWIWLYTGYSYAGEQEYVQGFEATPTGSLFGLSAVSLTK